MGKTSDGDRVDYFLLCGDGNSGGDYNNGGFIAEKVMKCGKRLKYGGDN